MFICEQPVSRSDLRQMAAVGFGDMVKGVVDVDRELLALERTFTLISKRSSWIKDLLKTVSGVLTYTRMKRKSM